MRRMEVVVERNGRERGMLAEFRLFITYFTKAELLQRQKYFNAIGRGAKDALILRMR